MRPQQKLRFLVATSAVLGLVAGCGGDDGDAAAPAPVVTPTTTSVTTTVADGAIGGATVCLDKNANGVCDTDETKGTTDAIGKVTLAVPNADVGKYPLLAVIGTTAVDAVNGPVTTAYTLLAPADQTAVVTPLTTLVQQTVAMTGASTADAARTIQSSTGITGSLFQDLSQSATAPTDGSVDPVAVARLVVLATQQQAAAIATTLGTPAADSTTITQADLDKATRNKVLELLPSLVAALADPSVAAATTAAAKEAALSAAATSVVSTAGLTAAAVPTVVAINTQTSSTAPAPTRVASAFVTLDGLSYSSAGNYYTRVLTGTLAQDTPDASGTVRYTDRRTQATGGTVARWSSGGNPARNADLSWNGSAWVGCPINAESTNTVRDAAGNSTYVYCSRETGSSNRATFDIAGKTMASVYAQIIAAGYTNLSIADAANVLGGSVFPTDAKLFYQTNTPKTEAVSYYPAGANLPAGVSNVVAQYSAAVSAGGDASTQAAGTACNSSETFGNGTSVATLEDLIASRTGTPCVFAAGSLTYNNTSYPSGDRNEWWGNSTASLGTLGTVSTTPGSTSTGYYTGNTLLRVAFKGTGTNPVTYYACQQRFVNGSTRNCTPIGTGSYTITTLGDARALSFSNLPPATVGLGYDRVFVERGGYVYFGYQNKPTVSNRARFNTAAAAALMTALGIPTEDPDTPLALTAASYQGTWEIHGSTVAAASNVGTVLFVNGNGTSSCQDRSDSTFYSCTLTITDPMTGAFSYSDATGSAQGTFDFAAGTTSGTYHDTTSTPADGSFVGGRR